MTDEMSSVSEEDRTEDGSNIPSSVRDQDVIVDLAPAVDDTDFQTKVKAEIERNRADTENRLAMILVYAIVASLPLMFLVLWALPTNSEIFQTAFERWLTLIGPLAGAAVGFGASVRRSAEA